MTMSLQDMRDFVRNQADAEIVDAPDVTLDVYARLAYNDIHSRCNLPTLQVTYNVTTVAGQKEYAFTTIPSGDLDRITSVVDLTNLGRRLVFMTKSDADVIYGSPVGMTSDLATAFAVENGKLTIYPTPQTSGKVYSVRGIRNPTAWPTSAGSVPDLPASLHEAVAFYMLAMYYLSQEDTNLHQVYLGDYERMVERFIRNESFRDFSNRNNVMGGQNFSPVSFTRWVRGNLE